MHLDLKSSYSKIHLGWQCTSFLLFQTEKKIIKQLRPFSQHFLFIFLLFKLDHRKIGRNIRNIRNIQIFCKVLRMISLPITLSAISFSTRHNSPRLLHSFSLFSSIFISQSSSMRLKFFYPSSSDSISFIPYQWIRGLEPTTTQGRTLLLTFLERKQEKTKKITHNY